MSDYKPINCEFHDVLEALATTRQLAVVQYVDAAGIACELSGVIKDVYGREGVEYLDLSTGQTLRLDRLLAVNGVRLADF